MRSIVLNGTASLFLCSLVNCGWGPKAESAEQALTHGREFVKTGDYVKAIDKLRIATQTHPTAEVAKEAHYWLGYAFEQQHDLPSAQAEYSVVALEDDHFYDVRLRLAKIMVRALNPLEAMWGGQWIEREVAETHDHASADAYYVLGVRAVRQGHGDEAQKYFERALSIEPGHLVATKALTIAALLQGDRNAAEKALLALPKSAKNAELTGEFYRLTGDLANAEHWFREALQQDQNLSVASVNFADTQWMMGKRQEALDVLSAVYQSGMSPFEHLHAIAALANGDSDRALSELTTLAKRPKYNADAESRLIAALIAAKRPDGATSAATARLSAAPTDPRAGIDRISVLLSGPCDLTAVAHDLDSIRKLGVNSGLFHYMAGGLAVRRGPDFDLEAVGEFNESVSVDPNFWPARMNWARAVIRQKEDNDVDESGKPRKRNPDAPAWKEKLPLAIEHVDEGPLDERRRPSAVLQRVWLFLSSGQKLEAMRLLQSASLSLPVALDTVTPAAAMEFFDKSFPDNLRFDLLEFPQGTVFQETDMQLLSFYPLNKGVVRWMAF